VKLYFKLRLENYNDFFGGERGK